jgi:alkylated DNA repair dioxygenase AlkB
MIEHHAAICEGGSIQDTILPPPALFTTCTEDSKRDAYKDHWSRNEITISTEYKTPSNSTRISSSAVSQLWNEIKCLTCQNLFFKTHVAHPCGHLFCVCCISQGLESHIISSTDVQLPRTTKTTCPSCHARIETVTWLRQYDDMIRDILISGQVTNDPSDLDPSMIQKDILTFLQRHEGHGSYLTLEEHESLFQRVHSMNTHHNNPTAINSTVSSLVTSKRPSTITPMCQTTTASTTAKESSPMLVWKRIKTFSSTIPPSPCYNVQNTWTQPLPGLFVFEDFISPAEEMEILQYLDSETLPWKLASFNGPHYGKRWGVHCNLRDRKVSEAETPLPLFFHHILFPKLQALLAQSSSSSSFNLPSYLRFMIQDFHANEANAIRYHKKMGHALASHCDDRQLSKEMIANLSLEGDCYMMYKNEKWNKENQTNKLGYKQALGSSTTTATTLIQTGKDGGERNDASVAAAAEILIVPGRKSEGVPSIQIPSYEKVLLKRRTLQLLTGRSRYDYSHGICNHDFLNDTRVSITMRESPLMK